MNNFSTMGVFTTEMALNQGISKYQLKVGVDQGQLEKVAHGVYMAQGQPYDGYAIIHYVYPRGIFAKLSALDLYGLTDEIPKHYDLAFPRGYHAQSTKANSVLPFHQTNTTFSVGLTHITSSTGVSIPVYSRERTILDVWEDSKIENYVRIDALKRYIRDYYDATSSWELASLKQKLYPESNITDTLEVLLQ